MARLAFALVALLGLSACHDASQPSNSASASTDIIIPLPTPPKPSATASSLADGSASPSANPSGGDSGDLASSPKMTDDSGAPLPQTKDQPTDSPAFQKRMQLLWEAIQKDQPQIAEPAFFPKSAYVQVKDVKKAEVDWDNRLMKAFVRDIHSLHKKLGKNPDKAQFESVKVDDKRAKWVDKGGEGNKIGYYRVYHTNLTFKNEKGKEVTLRISSLISWRGEWFVVHLEGFK